MKIAPYWSKARYAGRSREGGTDSVVACGWSFSSMDDARNRAALRAKHIFDILASGKAPNAYEYSDRPVREEIVKELADGPTSVALITRNRYGALVLNSASVLFADVDFPKRGSGGLLESLLFLLLPKKREAKRQAQILETANKIERWAHSNPAHSFRLYRTLEGMRLLFTGRLYDPSSDETLGILRGLESDPMYIRLTRKQECFRARLTAKPWRCGCPRPPNSYPWESADAERKFRDWERQYAAADAKFRTCEFVKAFGIVADSAAIKSTMAAHDHGTRIDASAPLA